MIQSTRINDNIFLHYIPMEKLKTTTLGLFIHRAMSEEEASKNALLASVLKRGCKLCKDGASIAKYLQNLYGASFGSLIQKKGDDQVISFAMESISDKYAPNGEKLLDSLTDLLLSVVFEPVVINGGFDKDIVNQEKANLKDRINGLINDKREYAVYRCVSAMCENEPVGIYRYGSAEGVDRVDEVSLYEHYKKIITSSVIDIYICGDTDVESIKNKISAYTDKMSFAKAEIACGKAVPQSGEIKTVKDNLDVTQGKLAIGFRTNIVSTDKDYYGLVVANSIFGAGAHSKLFNNVREKLSLAYYAASRLYKQNGLMVMDAGIEFENYQKAYDETLVQLENIKKGDITENEFDSSIKAIVNSLNSYYDDQNYMTDWYLSQRPNNTEISIDEMIEGIEKVTMEDVKNAARKIQIDTVYFLAGKEEN